MCSNSPQEMKRNLLIGICSSHLGIIALIQHDNVIPLVVKSNPLLLMPILSISAPEVFAKLQWTSQQLYSSSAIMITLTGMKVLLSDNVGKGKSLSDLLSFISLDESDELQALTFLSGVVSYLDVWLYLETKFNLEKKLVQSQAKCTIASKVVVDEFSLLRHHIILRSYCPGGHNEQLSCDSLQKYLETDTNGEINLLNTLPTSFLSYTDCLEEQSNQLLEIQKIMGETMNDPKEKEWLIHVRKMCRTYFTAGIEAPVLLHLLEEVSKCYKDQTEIPIDWSTQVERNLHSEEEIGIELVIRYGKRLKMLKMEQHKEKLGTILKQGISRNIECFLTFDWFTSYAYLLCKGNKERCIKFMEQFSRLPVAPYVWPSFASQLGYEYVSAVLCHHLKFVCLSELPLACAALKMANVPWTTVFYTWISQSFWNVLNWSQICQWLTLNLLYPPDICVYFCVAILRHLQPHLLAASSQGNVWDCIQNPPLSDFNVGMYIAFIEKMTKRYQTESIEQLMQYTMKIKTQ